MSEKALRLLLITEESKIIQTLEPTFHDLGHEVTILEGDVSRILESFEVAQPHLIFVDIQFLEMIGGLDMIGLLVTKGIPIIYLVLSMSHETFEDAESTDPYSYLVFPFTRYQVQVTITATMRKYHEQQITLEQDRWHSKALQSLGEALIVTDEKGNIRFMNMQAERLTGRSFQNLSGKNIRLVFSVLERETRTPASLPVKRVLHEGMQFNSGTAHVLVAQNGLEIPISERMVPLRKQNGDIEGMVISFRAARVLAGAMKGDLGFYGGAMQLLQTFSSVWRQGALNLERDGHHYLLYFSENRIVHFEHSEFDNKTALLQLAILNEGVFSFDPNAGVTMQSMNEDPTAFLMSVAKELDEARKVTT